MKQISRNLPHKRDPSTHSIERKGKPASELFTKTDAQEALQTLKKFTAKSKDFSTSPTINKNSKIPTSSSLEATID
jgi:hypothetical protein